MFSRYDGAPSHSGKDMAYVNPRYASRWIGRAGLIPRPPRSPDLTSLDFFVCSFTKEMRRIPSAQVRVGRMRRIMNVTEYKCKHP
jgi:hypothetical protein